ncbi:transcription repressor OFP11-like [Zingiber officinale]|uniref:Transcription repressor n=1 Tax=Zingiber officinale TaxID=94328 RepID=A0A8J5ITF4_ZINOF|nr:transcription repressor OFP11-like [Zingiber officinale]KAG6538328.1 hypothetical protein ZIOFF_003443 [Zingiber officinale]
MGRNKSTSCVPKPSKQSISKLLIHLWFTSRRRLVGGPSSAGRQVTATGEATAAVNLSHVDRYLLENFPSLFGGRSHADGHEDKHNGGRDYDDICWSYYISRPDEVSPRLTLPSPRAMQASDRFFVPATARASSSLAEEAGLQAGAAECGGEAVVRISSKPYEDFRRSMEEMVEAQGPGRRPDWEFMQRLLFSYLELNEQSLHGEIVRAFTDLTSSIRCATRTGRRT